MTPVSEAKFIIHNSIQPLTPVTVDIQHAAGLVLANDVYALVDVPAFDQSNMDGYAFRFEDHTSNAKLTIVGEVPAGFKKSYNDLSQKAVRIFTGAPVPAGFDTVVMQEKVIAEGDQLLIQDDALIKGSNVRLKGADIKVSDLALKAGSYLSPAAIGFLAGIGTSECAVYPKPAISIIVTGKELQQPGKPLQLGQVYESNSLTLKAALQQLHINNINIITVDDDLPLLQQALQTALQQADVVLLTGGISVGDYDFVLQAASLCGVKKLFHRVKQKPGKPLFFGKKENRLVFGLPGNPSSVLTCFYEYIILALEKLTCRQAIIKTQQLPLAAGIQKKAGLTHFLKGAIHGNEVIPLGAQDSYRLSSFATAGCLICLNEEGEEFKKGDMVEVHILPAN